MKKITYLFLAFLSFQFSFSQCPTPYVTQWSMTGDGALFDGNNQSEVIGYEIHYSTSDFTLGDPNVSIYQFISFPHEMAGVLETGTTYYMTIRSVCGDNDYSDWEQNPNNNGNGPDIYTTTNCASSYSLPYLNDFNDPDFWTACQAFEDVDADGNFWNYINYTVEEEGDYVAMSESYSNTTGVLFPDNWLVMGPVDLTSSNDAELTWKARGIDSSWCEENYSVYVSVYSNSNAILGDENAVVYNETISSLLGDGCGDAFGERSLDISAAAGNLVYIALRHHDIADMWHLNIDDVAVTSSTMSIDDIELGILHSYDKTSKLLKIQSSSDLITGVEIYDLNGRMIQSNSGNEPSMMISFESFENGIYIVNVSTEVGQKSIKLLKQ